MITIGNAGYYWLDTWVMGNVVQLATQRFCMRFLDRHNDPCGRQFDQMTQAARSVPANIAEGNARHATSKETEMKLTDVARASLSELAGDYVNWLMLHENAPWSVLSQEYQEVAAVRLDAPAYKDDVQHQSSMHILAQKHKFDRLSYRAEQSVEEGAPACPRCGKPMIKRMARKGMNSGKEFWSCSAYPECNGTRNIV